MKKLILTSAIILGISLTTFADGGLFNRGNNGKNGTSSSGYSLYFTTRDGDATSGVDTPMLPNHGSQDNEAAPLGSGIAMLLGLGAAYAVAKKRNEK